MKNTTQRLMVTVLFAASLAFGASAQPQGFPGQNGQQGQPVKLPSVDEVARQKTDVMKQEVGLTDKQYKQVYKLFKSQVEKERGEMENKMPQGFPGGSQGGFPGGAPGMGGGPGMNGGPGMGGGRPPMGGPGQGGFGGQEMGGGRPPMGPPDMRSRDEELEKIYAQNDKKLKKILTDEQYTKWRSKHHRPQPPMPDIELK